MEFDFRVIGILSVLMLLLIALVIITGLGPKISLPTQFLTQQIGVGS